MKIKKVRDRGKYNRSELFDSRLELVEEIDPLHVKGSDLHEEFMKIAHQVNSMTG